VRVLSLKKYSSFNFFQLIFSGMIQSGKSGTRQLAEYKAEPRIAAVHQSRRRWKLGVWSYQVHVFAVTAGTVPRPHVFILRH